jgi:hypothetical protein
MSTAFRRFSRFIFPALMSTQPKPQDDAHILGDRLASGVALDMPNRDPERLRCCLPGGRETELVEGRKILVSRQGRGHL